MGDIFVQNNIKTENNNWFWQIFSEICSIKEIAPSTAAREMGISTSALNNWKNGGAPFESTIKKIARYFNIDDFTITDILSGLTSADSEESELYKSSWREIVAQRIADPSSEGRYRESLRHYKELFEKTAKGKVKPEISIRIPVLGRVAAGIPIEAITDIDDYEEISPEMAKNGQYIALRIHGRSMEPRMCENDIIIVRLQNDVESGDIAVVFVNGGDATCKKIKKLQDGIMLISTNHEYDTMYYTNKQVKDLPIKILGKVVEIRVKL